MKNKTISKKGPIYKVNRFYLISIIWAIIVQFLPIKDCLYQYIALLIPIIIYLILNRKNLKRILKLNPLNKKSFVIIFIIWIFMLPFSIFIITIYNSLFGNTLANMVIEETANSFIGVFFFTALTPAIIEEIFMRGIVLDGYRHKNVIIASIINGLMFGMLHLNTFQFFHTFFAGIVSSLLVYSTNSIYSSVFIHFVNNGFPLIMDLIIPAQNTPVQTTKEIDFLFFGVIVILSLIIVVLLIHRLANINNMKLKYKKKVSKEKIFNKHLKLSMIIFLGFSLILSFSLKQT